jgi:HEAT repeat protein
VVKALEDTNVAVRRNAARSLAAMGGKAEDALPALNVALRDPKEEVQQEVATALAKVGKPALRPVLEDALKDANAKVRQYALAALGQLGVDAGDVRSTPKDDRVDVRRGAPASAAN